MKSSLPTIIGLREAEIGHIRVQVMQVYETTVTIHEVIKVYMPGKIVKT